MSTHSEWDGEGVKILQMFESSVVICGVKGQARCRGFLMFLECTLQCTVMLLTERGSHGREQVQTEVGFGRGS